VLESYARIILKLMLMLKICNTARPYRLNFVMVQKNKDLLFRIFQPCETFFQALISLSLGLELIALSHVLVYIYYRALQNRKLLCQ